MQFLGRRSRTNWRIVTSSWELTYSRILSCGLDDYGTPKHHLLIGQYLDVPTLDTSKPSRGIPIDCWKELRQPSQLPSTSRGSPITALDDSDEESNIGTRFEDSELRRLDRADLKGSANLYSVHNKLSKNSTADRNFMGRPDMHAGLHVEDVGEEYASPYNIGAHVCRVS